MISYFAIYVLYIFVSILNYICVRVLLRPFPDEKAYYSKLWWVVLTFPIYNLINSIIRLIGSINLITRPTKWNAEKFSVERKLVYKRIRMDLKSLKRKKG
jgi:hypothetical protein